jgi:hypothetical protein
MPSELFTVKKQDWKRNVANYFTAKNKFRKDMSLITSLSKNKFGKDMSLVTSLSKKKKDWKGYVASKSYKRNAFLIYDLPPKFPNI